MQPNQQTIPIAEAILIAMDHQAAGRLHEAENICRQVLQVDPNHPDALHLLGLIANALGNHGDSVELLDRAIRQQPSNPFLLGNRGNALQALKRFEDALKSYDQALAIKPDFLDALNNRGVALVELERYEEALSSYERALAINPQSSATLVNIALAHFNMGTISLADESMARVFALEPDRQDYRDLWQKVLKRPHLGFGGLQGAHAPERQVFMSSTVDLLKSATHHLAILEVGSYLGASLITWAAAVGRLHGGTAKVTCVDPWGLVDTAPQYDSRMANVLASNRAYQIFEHNASLVRGRIEVEPIRDLSENALKRMPDSSFDIVYIDGCHYYREALIDITEGKRLVKDGGILCGDDLELQGVQCDLKNARQNARADFIRDPKSGVSFHPGVTLAVHESLGKVSAFSGFWAMRKAFGKFEKVSFTKARGIIPSHWPEDAAKRIRAYFRTSTELGELLQ